MQYKITIITSQGELYAEIINSDVFPQVFMSYSLSNGQYGIPVKVELLIESDSRTTIDYTEINNMLR